MSAQRRDTVFSPAMPRWLPAVVVIGALGVASLAFGALFFPRTLLASSEHMNGAATGWARYAAAYSAALAASLLFLLAVGARRLLGAVLVQAAFVELLLALVGIANRRWEQIGADIVLIVAFVVCASVLLRQPVWRLTTWREES